MTENIKKTYFVTKHTAIAKAAIDLLTDRLSSELWEVTLNTYSVSQIYRRAKTRQILSMISLNLAAPSVAYMIDDKYVTLPKYLAAEQKLSQSQAILEQILSVKEHKYMLPGTSQKISFLSGEAGVYLSAVCSEQTHVMLSEYYALSNDPETLYSAVDEYGDLWALREEDFDDD